MSMEKVEVTLNTHMHNTHNFTSSLGKTNIIKIPFFIYEVNRLINGNVKL